VELGPLSSLTPDLQHCKTCIPCTTAFRGQSCLRLLDQLNRAISLTVRTWDIGQEVHNPSCHRLRGPVMAPRLPRLPGRGVDRNLGSSQKPVSRQHSGNPVCNPCASCITFAGLNHNLLRRSSCPCGCQVAPGVESSCFVNLSPVSYDCH
jgi:hypothetical protein